MECARELGIVFRSYSSGKTPGRSEDFSAARIHSFPTLILSENGIEIGRFVCGPYTPPGIILGWLTRLTGLGNGDIRMPPVSMGLNGGGGGLNLRDMDEEKLMEAFRNSRLRAEEPENGWPERFGVITAHNPMGQVLGEKENANRTERLKASLEAMPGVKAFFPVSGYDLNSPHEEAGFGVVCSREKILELGKLWEQLAVFWVEDGMVWLLSCRECGEQSRLGSLEEMLRV